MILRIKYTGWRRNDSNVRAKVATMHGLSESDKRWAFAETAKQTYSLKLGAASL